MTGNFIFNVPDIGEGTAVAELVAWHIKPGDQVEEDQPIADLMTDKATVEITSPVAARVLLCHGEVGQELAVGSAFVEFAGADGRDMPAVAEPGETAPSFDPVPVLEFVADAAKRAIASPAVRRRAREMGIPLEAVRGSGPAGRIRQPDLETYLAYLPKDDALVRPVAAVTESSRHHAGLDEITETPLIGLRRKIAQKMTLAARSIPHFCYVEEVDVTALEDVRERLNAYYGHDRPKLTVLPFMIVALCRALSSFPRMNSRFDEEANLLREYRSVHVGIATQTPNGLVVPVVRNAGGRGLWDLAADIAQLAGKARDGTLAPDELVGSTITITSLGKLGGLTTTPVINHPEVVILGPNRIVERPVAADGVVAIRKMMNLSSSFDHRIVDGQEAALFIQALKAVLEEPAILLAS